MLYETAYMRRTYVNGDIFKHKSSFILFIILSLVLSRYDDKILRNLAVVLEIEENPRILGNLVKILDILGKIL